jgi:aryl-phospho-beta-D-glucosidase BglC (GH1 family)
MIDNHSFDPNVDTSPDIGNILTKVWSQTASHLKDRSDYILYEILNEPHGITTSAWGTIQNQVISAIREKDTRHMIVVGGSGYNSYNELQTSPIIPIIICYIHFIFMIPSCSPTRGLHGQHHQWNRFREFRFPTMPPVCLLVPLH